jgi:hypothetical protein
LRPDRIAFQPSLQSAYLQAANRADRALRIRSPGASIILPETNPGIDAFPGNGFGLP